MIAVRSNGTRLAQLPDEGAERLVHLERRAERAGAAVRSVEEIRATSELVAEILRLGRALEGDARLGANLLHEPADDQGDHDHDPHLERDVRPLVALVEVLRAKRLVADQHRHAGEGQPEAAADAVAERCLDQDEDQHLPDRSRSLEVQREDERRDDQEVERERREAQLAS